ncbi:uncharacterized protein LOC109285271 isoform X2 [Alligator mississippiensis]|uniref:uncharacterized protein LOC109285271 isoform X2 n=1 Tax=Alligator mississippiensis TaxID=8496 RepID=UPI0028773326|nr:uncharacterized protein LOC109285271 isoform X2 [Alligator mississippiensis]
MVDHQPGTCSLSEQVHRCPIPGRLYLGSSAPSQPYSRCASSLQQSPNDSTPLLTLLPLNLIEDSLESGQESFSTIILVVFLCAEVNYMVPEHQVGKKTGIPLPVFQQQAAPIYRMKIKSFLPIKILSAREEEKIKMVLHSLEFFHSFGQMHMRSFRVCW